MMDKLELEFYRELVKLLKKANDPRENLYKTLVGYLEEIKINK